MLKPVKMSKIRVICLKAIAPQVVKALHNLSVLHITDSALPELERAGPLPSYDEVAGRLVKIRALREALGTGGLQGKPEKGGKLARKKQAYEDPIASADELLRKSDNVFTLFSAKDALSKELDANIAAQKSLGEIVGLDVDFSELDSLSLQFMLVRVPKEKMKLAREVLAATKNCTYTASEAKSGAGIMLVALRKGEDAKFLEGFGAVSPLPQILSTPKKEIEALRGKEAELRGKMEASEGRFAKIAGSLHPQAVSLEEALTIEADRAQVATSFGASASLYFIEGWAEAAKFSGISAELSRQFGKKLHVSHAAHAHTDVPPTLLDNPNRAKPFEYLVGFVSLPQYNEIDPSILLALIIPLMYALILGDAGYAALSFCLAYWMVKKSEKGSLLNQVALIWMIAAVPAFIFGIAFDEYFGFTHTHLASVLGFAHVQLYQGFHRVEEITVLMQISIIVGTLHLALGFILGAINEWHHSKKHAAAKLFWLGILIAGFFTIAGFMYGMFPPLTMPAAVLLGLCVAGLLFTEGVLALIEIPSLLGNVMSYLRIAAVGVGGVIIAEMINSLLMPHFELSLVGVLVFIVTAALYLAMHFAACILVMFEAIVHGARLSVVEFFGKFYRGGGVRFAPFAVRRNYTQEV
ncbi:MAG: V-type ATPase 116kDa subunit family protein [Candidatus Micrarchaeia archaeon]|jgi:V/A-type H+-transporting ATPase subunit I